MSLLQIIILSVVQGLTEFLPVSSSAHLILVSKFTSFPDQGLDMDVAVHIGSIIAVMLYFSKDIWRILVDLFKTKFIPNMQTYGSRLFWLVVIGTIPAVFVGIALHAHGTEVLRNTKIIGWNILAFGIILWIADHYAASARKIDNMDWKDALIIGMAQCFALIPGTSRSGITITTSRLLGIERREAAKFCMLLSLPTIAGAGLLVIYSIIKYGSNISLSIASQGIFFSFLASFFAIGVMMQWLKTRTFLPFVIYRIGLGIFLLLYSYGYIQ